MLKIKHRAAILEEGSKAQTESSSAEEKSLSPQTKGSARTFKQRKFIMCKMIFLTFVNSVSTVNITSTQD